MTTAIWWIRRDVRLHDNPALQAALENSRHILPVFVLDPKLLESRYVGDKRKRFLFGGLQALHADLEERGSYLLVRKGNPVEVLAKLMEEVGASRLYAQEDFSPYARARDRRVEQDLALTLTPGIVVHHPENVLKDDGDPYTVYTPYSRTWRALDLPRPAPSAPEQIPTSYGISGESLPTSNEPSSFAAGEAIALDKLQAFTCGQDAPVYRYADDRNRVDLDGTSSLSPLPPVWDAVRGRGGTRRARGSGGRAGQIRDQWRRNLAE